MLTKNEITALSLSPTKKDFVQIWNELLEVAGKLSERWDPTSTNESDPGIVLLKVLTGIADKLNYNIDKNILEAFMPTAAQEDSMRKLCDMMGYSMKYYRSAETDVTIKYYNADPSDEETAIMNAHGTLKIPKFTVITNSDKDISYFTTNQLDINISNFTPSITLPCMEGQIVKCESNTPNNVITANQVSESYRFYLPETMIAENGIFVYNVAVDKATDTLIDGTQWTKVDNLNVQARESRVFKFGFDSYEGRPYIEFPEDYSKLFNEGIFIYYARTNGVNGNVSPGTLTQLELPSTGLWASVSLESFSAENMFAANSGANAETIKQAYNNFKKTVGTFETLVTCRDYMNKIYSFVENGKPLVSNVLVTDIRNDINKAITICSCDYAGIFYKDTPLSSNMPLSDNTKPVFSSNRWHLGSEAGMPLSGFVTKTGFSETENGEVLVKDGHWAIKQNGVLYKTMLPIGATDQAISNFDIVIYPFKSFNQIKSNVTDIKAVYDASFNYTESQLDTITQKLDAHDLKAISHSFKTPEIGDVLSINNYLRISATIATNAKVTADECVFIRENIKKALANAFNMRELDFGDEIPFDSIVEVIEEADTRIKVASLNEPALYTTFSVLEGRDNNVPVIAEYAVASDWLDAGTADKIGRFTKETENGETISTFDTAEARKIYNKLAVRNVLAGRVPLFDYNKSFTTSFSESAYQVTTIVPEKPTTWLHEPDEAEPFTMWVNEDGIVYTGQYYLDPADEVKKRIYTKTEPVYQDGIITEATNNNTTDNYITDLKAECRLLADDSGKITDVTLKDGELVKFRAPNFSTKKTYPAYVNYHLDLNNDTEATEPSAAKAESLFNILNSDLDTWQDNKNIKWQKVLDFFDIYTTSDISYKKTFTISQTVSAFTENNEVSVEIGPLNTTIGVGVANTPVENAEYTIDYLVAASGCVKLANKDFKADVTWAEVDGKVTPSGEVPLELVLEQFKNPFITKVSVLAEIKDAIDTALATYRSSLPTEHPFTVSLTFECVPFEAASLTKWEEFIRTCASRFGEDYQYQVLDFKPFEDNATTVLWRLFGEGYDIGKYVTSSTEKLLKFDKNYFGLLPDTRLNGIYLVKDIGKDAIPFIIKNNEEYRLRKNERLYIEYTPSTTTDEGTTKELAAVTEVYGEGTIIRPSGFEAGLVDSTRLNTSAYKQVTFEVAKSNSVQVDMHSLGASEQIEIRDFAKVTLTADSFSDLYVYKNFNGALESGGSSYTLKDGEYVFYTDKNKTEFAYFTTGTEVSLSKNVKLPEFDIIEISTIMDSGIQEIPWSRLKLNTYDEIVFQEFQYITLGAEDTVVSMAIINPASTESGKKCLSDSWRYCSDVEYVLAAEPDTKITLPAVNIQGERKGDGWEVCSTLELNVSAGTTQSLRSSDKVESIVKLYRTSTTGGSDGEDILSEELLDELFPRTGHFNTEPELCFKTNLACQACGNEINIDDVWSNPDKLKGFRVKVFAKDAPVIVQTKPGSVIPYDYYGDITAWHGLDLPDKEYLDLWNQVNLRDIIGTNTDGTITAEYDNALRLSVNLLPNTYGVFCIYVDYTDTYAQNHAKTWIEVLPGTLVDDITLLNDQNPEIEYLNDTSTDKLKRLYLNNGINCIRVNKTCKVFVKTSANAQGMLYFDELQLVNSLPVKYANTDITLHTQGLNLSQLGYLDASEPDSTNIDKATKTKMQKSFVDKLRAEIDKLVQNTDKEFTSGYTALTALLPMIQELVTAEDLIGRELKNIQEALKETDNERIKELIRKYKAVKEALEKEKDLLNALNNNTKTETLEQMLVEVLDSLTSISVAQQQIMYELSELYTNAEARLEKLSNKDILSDFTDSPTAEHAINDITAAVLSDIEEQYQEQLAAVAISLNNSANSASKNTLIAILNNLKASVTATTRANLHLALNKLSNLVENEINDIIAEIIDIAYQEAQRANQDAQYKADYSSLLPVLARLRSILSTTDVKVIVSELINAANESNDERLSALLKELKSDAFNNMTDEAGIRLYISYLEEAITNTPADVLSKVDDLYDEIKNNYLAELEALFEEINEIVNKLLDEAKDLQGALNSLSTLEYDKTDKSTQVAQVIQQLKNIINTRNVLISGDAETGVKGLTSLTHSEWKENACAKFVEKAIINLWPSFMATRLSNILLSIESAANNAFNGTFDKADFVNIYANETSVMKLVVDTEYIETIIDKIYLLLNTSTQNASDAELVGDLSGLLLDSSELNTAVAALNNKNENHIIYSLIQEWLKVSASSSSAEDLKQKQKLQTMLKDELNKAIKFGESLYSIIANMLCPELTRYIKDFNIEDVEDTEKVVYEKPFNKLILLESALLDALTADGLDSFNSITMEDDTRYEELLAKPLADFRKSLSSFVLPIQGAVTYYNTLVPDVVINGISSLKDVLAIADAQTADIKTLSEQPLETATASALSDISLSETSGIKALLAVLIGKVNDLESLNLIGTDYEEAFKVLKLEDQLLADIRAVDINRDFYYNAPVVTSFAIDLNESTEALNTLMNPQTNYDINNINNNFVVSKLDIDFLEAGIQIARSSRIN